MDERLYITLLYDFYGGLLTDRQKEMLEMYYQSDLSLQEIGESEGISRQAVGDLIRRTKKVLLDYEARLGLVARHQALLGHIDRLEAHLDTAAPSSDGVQAMKDILREIKDL